MNRSRLDDCYDSCERLTKRAAGNFFFSFRGLPAPQYRAMCALYAFMRVTDDWGDDSHRTPAERLAGLDAWQQSLIAVLRPEWTMSPTADWPEVARDVLPAIRDVTLRYSIPHKYLLAVLDGVRSDLLAPQSGSPTCRFATFAQLSEYCYHVAGAVGLCCIHIWGFHGDEAISRAVDCGTAFQLTNILRDVGEDIQSGRVYLPTEDLQRFQVSIDDLSARCCDGRFRALMEFEVERAKTFYASAEQLMSCLEPRGRPILRAMLQLYGGLLQEMQRRKFDVFKSQVSLPRWRKLWIAADALIHQRLLTVTSSFV